MKKMWISLVNFFSRKKITVEFDMLTSETINDKGCLSGECVINRDAISSDDKLNSFSEVIINRKSNDEQEKLTHVAIVLKTIQKYYLDRGRFTSDELYFFIILNDYNITKKQFWRVLSKFNKFNYIDKIVLDSNSHQSYYVLTEKFYSSPTIKLY